MVRIALVVTSDRIYRGEREDRVRPIVEEWAQRRGYALVYYRVVPNDLWMIRSAIVDATSWADIVIVSGGTGPGPRDRSVDALLGVADKVLPGIGEEHRARSRSEVGLRAIVSRAVGATLGESLIVVSPGSPGAVKVMLEILDGVGEHIVWGLRGASHWDEKGRGERRSPKSSEGIAWRG